MTSGDGVFSNRATYKSLNAVSNEMLIIGAGASPGGGKRILAIRCRKNGDRELRRLRGGVHVGESGEFSATGRDFRNSLRCTLRRCCWCSA